MYPPDFFDAPGVDESNHVTITREEFRTLMERAYEVAYRYQIVDGIQILEDEVFGPETLLG